MRPGQQASMTKKRDYSSTQPAGKDRGETLSWLRTQTDEASRETPADSRPVRLALFTVEERYELHCSSFPSRTLSGLVAPWKLD